MKKFNKAEFSPYLLPLSSYLLTKLKRQSFILLMSLKYPMEEV